MVKFSGIGGLIYVFFLGVVFVVALVFAVHYWGQQNAAGIGQRKKHRLRKLMWRWTYGGISAAVIGLIGAACYYFAPVAILMQPSEKQYVSIVEDSLTALTVGTPPTLTIVLQNGPGKTTVNFHEVSFLFTPTTKHLKYALSGKPKTFTLTPHKKMSLMWKFDELKLSQAQ